MIMHKSKWLNNKPQNCEEQGNKMQEGKRTEK